MAQDNAIVEQTFANEEVGSSPDHDYPEGFETKSLGEQISLLRESFPDLGDPNWFLFAEIDSGEVRLPTGAEGWYAIPNPMKLTETYSKVMQVVIDAIKKNHSVENLFGAQLGPEQLRRTDHATEMIVNLMEMQGNPDILIVPAQFGKLYAGASPRLARHIISQNKNEFGLGAYEVACMLLTHPERAGGFYSLWIDCPGDECNFGGGDSWTVVPFYYFGDERLLLSTRGFDCAHSYHGSASGFLPLSP